MKSIEDELLAGASPDQSIAYAEDRLRHALAARPEHQAEVIQTFGGAADEAGLAPASLARDGAARR